MYCSGGSWHRPQNSHAVLLDKYWTKLQMGNMTREELKKVIGRVFMFNFTVVSTVDSLFFAKICACILKQDISFSVTIGVLFNQ